MTTTAEKDPMSALQPEVLHDLHRRMVRIRLFEEEAGKLMEGGRMPGFLHLYVGQEAVAAGVMATDTRSPRARTCAICMPSCSAR